MQGDEEFAPGFLSLNPKLALGRNVRLGHPHYVRAALT